MKSIPTSKKAQKGITLIALVVTIIVLLILAGISIMMLTGQNGILIRAQESSTRTSHAEVYEMLNLETAEYLAESKLGEYSGTLIDYLKDEKHYIYEKDGIDGYIVDVEVLLGAKGRYGNGTDGVKDVYKLEEVVEGEDIAKVAAIRVPGIEDKKTGKKYEVIYYGTTEEEKVSLGYLQDEEETGGKENDSCLFEVDEEGAISLKEGSSYYESYSYHLKDENGEEIFDVVIPSSINGKSVKKIPNNLFSGFETIKSVRLPNSITDIGSFAFYLCGSLTSINIPNGVTKIENSTFAHCSELSSINLPENLISIGISAFYECKGLPEITIPESLESIGEQAFSGCRSLQGIKIPKGVTNIGKDAFSACRELQRIDVNEQNNNYKSIDGILYDKSENELIRCPGGKEGELGNFPISLTIINESAFSDCGDITGIDIPGTVTQIGSDAFSGCKSLTKLDIPSSVVSIGDYAFSTCWGIHSINIPNSVMNMGSMVFLLWGGGQTINVQFKKNEIPVTWNKNWNLYNGGVPTRAQINYLPEDDK